MKSSSGRKVRALFADGIAHQNAACQSKTIKFDYCAAQYENL
jgi:hypothetical protein